MAVSYSIVIFVYLTAFSLVITKATSCHSLLSRCQECPPASAHLSVSLWPERRVLVTRVYSQSLIASPSHGSPVHQPPDFGVYVLHPPPSVPTDRTPCCLPVTSESSEPTIPTPGSWVGGGRGEGGRKSGRDSGKQEARFELQRLFPTLVGSASSRGPHGAADLSLAVTLGRGKSTGRILENAPGAALRSPLRGLSAAQARAASHQPPLPSACGQRGSRGGAAGPSLTQRRPGVCKIVADRGLRSSLVCPALLCALSERPRHLRSAVFGGWGPSRACVSGDATEGAAAAPVHPHSSSPLLSAVCVSGSACLQPGAGRLVRRSGLGLGSPG